MAGEVFVRVENFGIFSRNLDRRISALEVRAGMAPSGQGGSGGARAFTELSDVPSYYTAQGLKYVRVNSGASGLEFGQKFTVSASAPSGGSDDDVWFQYDTNDVFNFINLADVPASYSGQGGKLVAVNGGATGLEFIAHSAVAHDILSATHGDSTAGAVVRGDIITGQGATPKWARLAFPGTPTGKVLVASATDIEWSASALGTSAFTATATPTTLGLVIGTNVQAYNSNLTGINQALDTTASPAFVTVKCSALTDGYIPYHVSDAAGLANGPIYYDGVYVQAIGKPVQLQNSNIDGSLGDAIFFANTSYPTSYRNKIQSSVSGDLAYSALTFCLSSGAATYNEVMRIRGTSVLIGATAAVGSELLRVNGQIYGDGNISGLSFTDRTPYPKDTAEAWAAIRSMKHDGRGGVDHAALHPFIRVMNNKVDPISKVESVELGRNVSASLSAAIAALQDLDGRVELLEKAA